MTVILKSIRSWHPVKYQQAIKQGATIPSSSVSQTPSDSQHLYMLEEEEHRGETRSLP
jgi:hypothetical protein